MRVACCQFDIAWEDKRENYRRVERLVGETKLDRGTLLLLPEMFATGFSMNADAIAESLLGITTSLLRAVARELGLFVLAGVVVKEEDGAGQPRNEALLIDPAGNLLRRYAKVHRFTFAGEDRHYAAGDEPVRCHVGGWKVQPTICYDLRFPELYRAKDV